MNEYHAEHALEAAHTRRLKKLTDAAAEDEKRWARRILPLLARETPDEEFE
jgi:hypothetical protein